MNARRCIAAILTVLFCCCAAGGASLAAAEADDVAGVWRWTTELADRTINSVLKLNVEEGKISGVYKNDRRETKVEEPKFEDGQLKFRLDFERNDRKMSIRFAGKPSGDQLEGTISLEVNGEQREFPWLAKRTLIPADVVGLWTFAIDTPNGQTLHPTLQLTAERDKLSGVYTSQLRNRTFEPKDLQLKDGQLSFEIAGEFDGQNFSVKYKGRPRGDNIAGAIAFDFAGNTGDVEFKGKRKDVEKQE